MLPFFVMMCFGKQWTLPNGLSVVQIFDIKKAVFRNLQLCYECEFGPHTKREMLADGSYDQIEIQSEWAKKWDIYILYKGEIPIGFVVVNHGSMVFDAPDAHDIAEFFVVPLHRKKGIGKQLAHWIFRHYPGRWEIRQIPGMENTSKKFWHKTINSIAEEGFQEFHNPKNWIGYVQKFSIT